MSRNCSLNQATIFYITFILNYYNNVFAWVIRIFSLMIVFMRKEDREIIIFIAIGNAVTSPKSYHTKYTLKKIFACNLPHLNVFDNISKQKIVGNLLETYLIWEKLRTIISMICFLQLIFIPNKLII